jgi:YggT family protein
LFILANFLSAIGKLISLIISVYTWVVIARVFVSWVSASPYNPVVRTIYTLTEPVLKKIRKFIPYLPVGAGYLDLSPLVLLFLMQFLDYFLVKTITEAAYYISR